LDETYKALYGVAAISGNWFGDETYGFPSFFADSINEKGLSCGMQTLVGTQYQDRSSVPMRENVFAGNFCFWAARQFQTVQEVMDTLTKVNIWGPDSLAQHFILHDSSGALLVVEVMEGKQQVYLDVTVGIATNEPTFDWHLENINHYKWKRSLARTAIAVPGSWYPEERFLRLYMVKHGMKDILNTTTNFESAFSMAAQCLNVVTVPMGNQYGTDSGSSSGEGDGDHTIFGLVRDHVVPTIYWRDAYNPSFRRVRLQDLDLTEGAAKKSIILESSSSEFFIDVSHEMS
jgi:choloylglycine hydrolase